MRPDLHNRSTDSLFDIPEEQKRLAAYVMQARIYLITNIDTIKGKYAYYVYQQLCKQEPFIEMHHSGQTGKIYGESHAINIIKQCVLLCDDMLVLCHPESGEPCVVSDAYTFTEFDIVAFEEQMLLEYIRNNSENAYPHSAFGKKAAIRGAKFGTGYVIDKAGSSLIKTGERLGALSKHYSSGHSSLMRINRSFRGKKAQQEALMKMFKKSADYGKSAASSKAVGGTLKWIASKLKKGAFKPITLLDALTPIDVARSSHTEIEQDRIERLILIELKKYCEKYNNYNTIMNQQYFIQG